MLLKKCDFVHSTFTFFAFMLIRCIKKFEHQGCMQNFKLNDSKIPLESESIVLTECFSTIELCKLCRSCKNKSFAKIVEIIDRRMLLKNCSKFRFEKQNQVGIFSFYSRGILGKVGEFNTTRNNNKTKQKVST